jgi:hypothetical protein
MGTTDLWPRSARSMLIKGHAGEAPFDGSHPRPLDGAVEYPVHAQPRLSRRTIVAQIFWLGERVKPIIAGPLHDATGKLGRQVPSPALLCPGCCGVRAPRRRNLSRVTSATPPGRQSIETLRNEIINHVSLRHRPLEHGLSRPGRQAIARSGHDGSRRSPGSHRPDQVFDLGSVTRIRSPVEISLRL